MRIPYPFQQQSIEAGKNRNLLINDAPGLGKTIQAAEVLKYMRDLTHKPSLVVTPKRAKEQFKNELILQGVPEEAIAIAMGGSEPLWVPEMPDWILVVHYETIVRHLRALARVKWGIIIADEGHYIKSYEAQRSKAIKKLRADRRIVMTGTPVERSPAELHSILEFLYPEDFKGKRGEFCTRFERAYWDDRGYKKTLPGAKHPEELANLISPFMFSRTKQEVAPDLPPNIITEVSIKLEGNQASLYERVDRSTDLEVDGPELDDALFIPSRLSQLVKLQQIAVDPRLVGSNAQSAKFEWLRDWRWDNPDEPTLIFSTFRDTAIYLAEQYDAHLIIGGRDLPPNLQSKNTIVATIAAGGTALDLGWIGTTIFVDINWRWNLHDQGINRMHRINITAPKNTIYLIAKGTVDEIMLASARGKWSAWEVIRAFVAARSGPGAAV